MVKSHRQSQNHCYFPLWLLLYIVSCGAWAAVVVSKTQATDEVSLLASVKIKSLDTVSFSS